MPLVGFELGQAAPEHDGGEHCGDFVRVQRRLDVDLFGTVSRGLLAEMKTGEFAARADGR